MSKEKKEATPCQTRTNKVISKGGHIDHITRKNGPTEIVTDARGDRVTRMINPMDNTVIKSKRIR